MFDRLNDTFISFWLTFMKICEKFIVASYFNRDCGMWFHQLEVLSVIKILLFFFFLWTLKAQKVQNPLLIPCFKVVQSQRFSLNLINKSKNLHRNLRRLDFFFHFFVGLQENTKDIGSQIIIIIVITHRLYVWWFKNYFSDIIVDTQLWCRYLTFQNK